MRREPDPFLLLNEGQNADVFLICDHASPDIPEALGDLGVPPADRYTHIAWDIGALEVAKRLSAAFEAPLVATAWSRLVIDANRPPSVESSIPRVTGGVRIAGNEDLTDEQRRERVARYFTPYHSVIEEMLDARAHLREGRGPVLLSIHSFTPELLGQKRPWPIALLYGRDARLAHPLRDALARRGHHVGDNEPYSVSALTDYAVPVHGEARGLLHTAFEIRQDGIATAEGALAWAETIESVVREVLPTIR